MPISRLLRSDRALADHFRYARLAVAVTMKAEKRQMRSAADLEGVV